MHQRALNFESLWQCLLPFAPLVKTTSAYKCRHNGLAPIGSSRCLREHQLNSARKMLSFLILDVNG